MHGLRARKKWCDVMQKPKTDLAYERTLFASERTLMAWVRTSVSLIGFGFSIPSFFSLLKDSNLLEAVHVMTPKLIGIFLTLLGIIGLVGGMWLHFYIIKSFSPHRTRREILSPAMIVSVGVAFVGLITLGALMF